MASPPLKGQSAFVAGGTRGMGYAVAALLAENGARVTVCGSTEKSVNACLRNVRRQKLPIRVIQLDVFDENASVRAIEALSGDGLDILVCCTGQALRGGALDISFQQWDHCMEANLRAPFMLSKAALPGMIAHRAGLIVFVSSIWAVTATPRRVPYIVAKAALSSLARALAMDVAGDGIRVNAVAPGYIDTDFLRNSLAQTNPGADMDELLNTAAVRHPMGRIGRPRDIAEAVLYLARSDFVTGQTLMVDGGLTTQFSLPDFGRPIRAQDASRRRTRTRG